jgi:2,3-bisphosphoglycerate-dependent phosphoglycerate mutase
MAYLVIMRHGESIANQKKIFTGWDDVSLTSTGIKQAHLAGKKLNQLNIKFTDAHTSYLKRSIETLHIVLEESHQLFIAEHKSWRLNERHYGSLRGHKKEAVRKAYGDKQFLAWRRSFKAVPPLLSTDTYERRYARIGLTPPRGESLQMAYQRLLPYWINEIAPHLLNQQNQLVVAHGSTLRALIKYLDHIDDDNISQVEVPNATPTIYEFDNQLNIINKRIM